MGFLLWLIAVAVVIYGFVRLISGEVAIGLALIILGFLIGPGGYSLFTYHR